MVQGLGFRVQGSGYNARALRFRPLKLCKVLKKGPIPRFHPTTRQQYKSRLWP
jgi:hypothetical protein